MPLAPAGGLDARAATIPLTSFAQFIDSLYPRYKLQDRF